MAGKLADIAGRLLAGAGGAGPKILAAAGLAGYGVYNSVYTVEGGHRSIIFSRIGGVQPGVYSEGKCRCDADLHIEVALHFPPLGKNLNGLLYYQYFGYKSISWKVTEGLDQRYCRRFA